MYSQYNEDEIIIQHINPLDGGFVLDIGANDGVTFSNSKMLIEKYNWGGVLVEPSKKCIEKLNLLYEGNDNVQVVPYGIDTTIGTKTLYVGNLDDTPNSMNQVSTLIKSEKSYWETSRNVVYVDETIDTITARELLSMVKIKNFDVISIDTEGLDFEILESLYSLNLRPKIIIIEHNSNSKVEKKISNLIGGSYSSIFHNTINVIYKLK